MDAAQLAAGSGQVARDARAGGEHDRVEALAQLLDGDVHTDVHAAAQLDALGEQLLDAPLHDALFDLEVGHAEAHQPAGGLVALEQGDGVADAAQLLGRRHAGGTGADDRDGLAGLVARRLGPDPPFAEGPVDDGVLYLLDRDGVALADLQHARSLARGGAQPAGEVGEVVGGVQLGDRLLPAVAVDEVVPVGDEVAQRAAVVAEGDAAFHAAGALVAQLGDGTLGDELLVVARALAGIAIGDAVALYLKEPAQLAHQARHSPPPTLSRLSRQFAQHALVVVGHHLHEGAARRAAAPSVQARRARRSSRCAGECSSIIARSSIASSCEISSKPTMPMLQRAGKDPSSSST